MLFARLTLVMMGFLPLAAASQQTTVLNIYFDHDRAVLRKESFPLLDSFAASYRSDPQEISLFGHCDESGTDDYNLGLSRKRVAAVRAYLVRAGVSPSAIVSAIGFGEEKPLNDNLTPQERQLNRRVELTLTGAGLTLKERIKNVTDTAAVITLKTINFIGGMHQFLPESNDELAELLDAMKAYPTLVIRVEGHICCESHAGDGLDIETGLINLSEARAKAVMDHLISNGIETSRISYKGFGHSVPLYPYPEKGEEERSANRRVEVRILSL
jgi:outer membrane protein OmpA-like peptidoglycan-associated protein